MASKKGKIYLTTNLVNNKIYIGQTWSTKNSYYGSGTYIKKAILKYGKSNFERRVLIDNVESQIELDKLESLYIKLYNSRNSKIGYNAREGGKGSSFNHTTEALEKISNRSNQEDNKLRIRRIQKIGAKSRIGQHFSKESKLKMMNTKFGVTRKIEIYKDDTLIHTCDFSKEASKFTKVKRATISNNLIGLSKSAGGYVFKYNK